MNKKFIIAIICIAMITSVFMCSGVFAAECSVTQTGDTEVTVAVKSSTDRVSISVFPDGKSYSDLLASDKTNYNDIMVYGNEFEVEPETEKIFKMDLGDCRAGSYTIYVSERGKVTEFNFDFERKDLKREALSKLNESSSADEIIKILDNYSNELGISDADWTKADKEVVAEYIANADFVLKEDDADTNNLFKSAATVGLIANGEVSNIYSRIDSFELSETDLEGWYNADFVTEKTQLDITERLSGEEITSADDFEEAFTEAYILSVIENADNYVNVKKVVEEFAGEIGVSAGQITVKEYSKLAGVDFDSLSALETRIESMSGDGSSGSASGRPSGGGSGGGGGSSSGGGGVLHTDDEEAETQEKLHVDIFTDLNDVEWARASIVGLAEKSIISGKGGTLFCPNDNITRYEFAKIAVLTFLPDSEEAEIAFTDVSADHWAYEYVRRAFGAGLITGRTESTFDGDGNITREEMAAILLRAANASEIELSDFEDAKNYVFRDDAEISDYAKEAVYILKHDGVINGVGNESFAPAENATRAQAAHMVYGLSRL